MAQSFLERSADKLWKLLFARWSEQAKTHMNSNGSWQKPALKWFPKKTRTKPKKCLYDSDRGHILHHCIQFASTEPTSTVQHWSMTVDVVGMWEMWRSEFVACLSFCAFSHLHIPGQSLQNTSTAVSLDSQFCYVKWKEIKAPAHLLQTPSLLSELSVKQAFVEYQVCLTESSDN